MIALDSFEQRLIDHQWRSLFSDQEWLELLTLSSTGFDLKAQSDYWTRLLNRWDGRNLNPVRPVYQELLSIIDLYRKTLSEQPQWHHADWASLDLLLADSQVQLQQQQLSFWRFEHEQKQQRIERFHREIAKSEAEFYNLSELTQFISQNLKEEPNLIHDALDGLKGVLDASWAALYLYHDASGQCGTFYRYQANNLEIKEDYIFPHSDFWTPFWKTPLAQSKLESFATTPPELEALFPGSRTLLTQALQCSNQGRGLLMVCSPEPEDFFDFRQFFSIFTTHVASAIENARLHHRLNELAIRDALTGVFNRGHLEERLYHAYDVSRRYGRELSLLMLDIDHFKLINDTYGHPVGDEVLKQVAAIISHRLRSTDIIGRYGGEEFVAILQETGLEGAKIVAEDLVKKIAEAPIVLKDQSQLNVTVSVGYAAYPVHAAQSEHLIDLADAGLYHAKKAGRNQVGFVGA